MKITRRQLRKIIREGINITFDEAVANTSYPIKRLYEDYDWEPVRMNVSLTHIVPEFSGDLVMVDPEKISSGDRLYLGVKSPSTSSSRMESFFNAGAYRKHIDKLMSKLEEATNKDIKSRRILLPLPEVISQLQNMVAWGYVKSRSEPLAPHPEGIGYMLPIEWSLLWEGAAKQHTRLTHALSKVVKKNGSSSKEAHSLAYMNGYNQNDNGVNDLASDLKQFEKIAPSGQAAREIPD